MTQPTLPSAESQQQAAVEVFAQYEPPLYEAYLEMMLEWLAAVKTAMFTGGVVSLGLVPDPIKVFSQTPKWEELTSQYAEDVAREVLAAPYKDLFADGTFFESRPFVRNWIAARKNRLSHVPDEVYGAVAQIIDSATTNGASIPDVQAQIEQLFSDTDVKKWKDRARTVARTEVVGAYNGGLYDAFHMLVDSDPSTSYVKRWLATEDHRTRPDHVKADGQTVPWGQPFDVGGFAMMYPHDPEGPPQEVINCVIGSTQVAWPGQAIEGATRRRYSGTFVNLITADGHDLTITPNHPVLTPVGYIPAGLLRPGQQVLAAAHAGTPGVSNVPASIEQVYSAASQAGIQERVVGGRMDFHGDGAETEVQVVRANGHLGLDRQTGQAGRHEKAILVGLDGAEVSLPGAGDDVVTTVYAGHAPSGRSLPPAALVSGDGLGASLGVSESTHSETPRLTEPAHLKPHAFKSQDDGRSADADFPAHLQYALAAGMTPTEVVKVDLLTETHDVFNLSTSGHWYSANGIAVHNCRCTLLLEIENEPTEMGNRQYKDALAAAGYPRSMTLMQFVCHEGEFCMQTHKPGLCKGQKRGESEPGTEDANKANPAVKAQIAVKGLGQAIQQAQQVVQANLTTNPKLAAMARRAIAGYRKALRPHQQTLKDAARTNTQSTRQGVRDAREQDVLDRRAQRQADRDQRKRDTLKKRAEAIIARRNEAAKVARMSPKQRAAYGKAKAAQAKAKHQAAENKVLKEAAKA